VCFHVRFCVYVFGDYSEVVFRNGVRRRAECAPRAADWVGVFSGSLR
jgi:hypothetical protein